LFQCFSGFSKLSGILFEMRMITQIFSQTYTRGSFFIDMVVQLLELFFNQNTVIHVQLNIILRIDQIVSEITGRILLRVILSTVYQLSISYF